MNITARSSGFLLRAWPSKVTRTDGLVYSSPDGEPLLADLYMPDDTPRPAPVILWLHPGGWSGGSRRAGFDLSRFIAERGFAILSIDYRLSGRAIFPAALEDVKSAIAWIGEIAGRHGLDAGRIGLWGASAGGHLAALAALSTDNPAVKAVVDAYGPVDFLRMGAAHEAADSFESLFIGAPIATAPDLVRQANPIAHVRPNAPPFLILHGLEDRAVDPGQSVLLYDALAAADNDVTLCLLEGLGHGFLRNQFDEGPFAPVRLRSHRPGTPEDAVVGPPVNFGFIETFFRRHLC